MLTNHYNYNIQNQKSQDQISEFSKHNTALFVNIPDCNSLETNLLSYVPDQGPIETSVVLKNNSPPISIPETGSTHRLPNLLSHAPDRCEGSADYSSGLNKKISECSTRYKHIVKYCGQCGAKFIVVWRCHHRLCPTCAKKRSREWFYKLVKVKFRYPLFLTLTLRSDDELEKLITTAINEFRAFCRRFKIKRVFRGIEIGKRENNDGAGKWFVHVHALVDCLWLPGSEARDYWEKRTNAYQINFKRPYNKNVRAANIKTEYITIGAIKEVCKYVTKGISNLKPEDLEEVDRAIRGRRLFSTFGIARSELALKLDTLETTLPKVCPLCGGKLWFGGIITREEVLILKTFGRNVFVYDDS